MRKNELEGRPSTADPHDDRRRLTGGRSAV